MPGRSYAGGGSFYRQNGKMTRNIGQVCHNGVEPCPQKREERAMREAFRKERKLDSYLADDENFPSFKIQLAKMSLQLRDIPADGNCLFRALGDQLEGHCRNHFKHRTEVVNFMRVHRQDFEPFVEDDMPFDDHVGNLQKLGTHAGNDAIVAFAKLHGVNVIIHQLNGKPLLIQGPATSTEFTRQLHLAYHNGDHYSSVRTLDDNTESPAHIRLKDSESDLKKTQKSLKEVSGSVVSAKRGLDDIEAEVAIATNCTDRERVRQVLCEYAYDVDASIANLLQQMELCHEIQSDDSTSLTSQRTSAADSGFWNHPAVDSNNSSPNTNSSRIVGSVLKANGNVAVSGKGHKVHFRDDSIGGSSGYGSLSSHKGGARPKIMPAPQKKGKEAKKLEKKKRAEERRKEKILGINHNIPQTRDVRDVTVVAMHDGRPTRI